MSRVGDWFKRYQEFAALVPGLVFVSLAAWVVFGALDRRLGTDALAMLLELAIRSAFAFAALGLANLALRRQRRRLGPGESALLWVRVLNGERGALIVYLTDTFVWSLAYTSALFFFWPSG